MEHRYNYRACELITHGLSSAPRFSISKVKVRDINAIFELYRDMLSTILFAYYLIIIKLLAVKSYKLNTVLKPTTVVPLLCYYGERQPMMEECDKLQQSVDCFSKTSGLDDSTFEYDATETKDSLNDAIFTTGFQIENLIEYLSYYFGTHVKESHYRGTGRLIPWNIRKSNETCARTLKQSAKSIKATISRSLDSVCCLVSPANLISYAALPDNFKISRDKPTVGTHVFWLDKIFKVTKQLFIRPLAEVSSVRLGLMSFKAVLWANIKTLRTFDSLKVEFTCLSVSHQEFPTKVEYYMLCVRSNKPIFANVLEVLNTSRRSKKLR